MTTVLVVDDSAVDRGLVGGLLEKDPDIRVDYGAHGAEALDRMECSVPDLVVTDLMMPQMDGLELVSAIREKYPLVPVILITSRGSEQIAAEALQKGAASYVPKQMMAVSLLSTVQRVLAVSYPRRIHTELMRCMTFSNCEFELENDSRLFGPLISYLQEEVSRMGLCDETECTRLGVALGETLANALYHGNLELGSALREDNDETYFALVEQRRHEPPYSERRIHVRATFSHDEARVIVRDEGPGFNPEGLPDPTDPSNLEKLTGRGVLLMRTFMDSVEYNEAGNVVTLIKCRDANGTPSPE